MTTTATPPWREIVAFVGVAYALALTVAVVLPDARINLLLSVAIPTVTVGVLTFTIVPRGRRLALWRGMGLGRAGLRTWPSAIAVPIGLGLSVYGAALIMGAGTSTTHAATPDPGWTLDLAVSLVFGTLLIAGEEIGWRGYLLPRIQQVTTRRKAAVATGFAHGCFHLPLILLASTYDTGGSTWFSAPAAVTVITAGGVFYAWLWDRAGTVWPVAVGHNVVNVVFDLGAVAVVVAPGWNLTYVTGETGVITLVACVVLAATLLLRAPVWQDPRDRPSVPAPAAPSMPVPGRVTGS